MSDEREEKRPKLKLSRDVDSPRHEEPEIEPAPPPVQKEGAPKQKLKLSNPAAAKKFSPNAPAPGNIPPIPKEKPKESPPAEPATSEKDSDKVSPTLRQSPKKEPASENPPPLPDEGAKKEALFCRTPTPAPAPAEEDSEPAPSIEEMLRSASPQKSEPGDNSVVSILIVVLLFLILCGAGLGIWWILKQPVADEPSIGAAAILESSVSPEGETTTQTSEATGPIARAKAVIAEVPTEQVEEIIAPAQTTPADEPTEAPAPTAPEVTTTDLPEATPNDSNDSNDSNESGESGEPGTTTAAAVNTATRATVIAFLSEVHIDGVRSGTNPKVMIAGESYLTGDKVDEPTGLSFEGIKNGKLQFKDRNGIYYLKSF